eukprot:16429660-Heterocapsa_arctica.AAC.1
MNKCKCGQEVDRKRNCKAKDEPPGKSVRMECEVMEGTIVRANAMATTQRNAQDKAEAKLKG